MHGIPKHLNSKYDYKYVKDSMPENIWRPLWEKLLQDREAWVCTGELSKNEVAVEDDRHKIEKVVSEDENGKKASKTYIYELRRDMSCDFIRLGFTEEEVKKALEKG